MSEDEIRNEKLKLTLEEEIKKLFNPWNGFTKDDNFNIHDNFDKTTTPFFWDETKIKNDDYILKNQFPLPINGNFIKAKYLLLYSNPATEKVEIDEFYKAELIKCFKLKEEAKLIIPNDDWRIWYQKQLDKFYLNDKTKIDLDHDFCFINLFAYQSATGWFDYSSSELDKIHNLETTKFVKKLVELGEKAGKTILVMRTSENVWKKYKNSNKDSPYMKLELAITEKINLENSTN